MKVTNHNRDNYYTIETYVMRGTITMTRAEFVDVVKFLKRSKSASLAFKKIEHGHVSFGITATEAIAKKYSLVLKDQNYGVRVI